MTKYQINVVEHALIISFAGNLMSKDWLPELIDELDIYVEEGINLFVVNVAELRHINSTGLSVLLTLLTKARNSGGELILANIPKHLNKLLIITKLNSIFTIVDSVEEGINALVV
ncbi:MAG: STAS domain-containing protein [Chitinophagales bacterium]